MQTMQPILTETLEGSDDFLYEIKYDGFRAILYWDKKNITIKSRRNTDLTAQFPEIIASCKRHQSLVVKDLPLQLDGELVILNNNYEANFSLIQKRGRMRSNALINKSAETRPATLMVFDFLCWKGNDLRQRKLLERKKMLEEIFPLGMEDRIETVATYTSYTRIKKLVTSYLAEGIVAKRKNAVYTSGKTHSDWFKEKNWRTVKSFITAFTPKNGYYQLGVYDGNRVKLIAECKHGLSIEEQKALQQIFKNEHISGNTAIPPSICAEIHTLGIEGGVLREPSFVRLVPEMEASACTIEKLSEDLAMLPESVTITNDTKLYWNEANRSKMDLLIYMRTVYSYMFPHLCHRALTLIRCPEGVDETCFFQKHLPEYSPDFMHREDKTIVCNNLDAVIWLANHGALEYHIPFEQLEDENPDQIVFDLDPPSDTAFQMAVDTALLFQRVFELLELTTFIKTSGNKGLQIHLPLPRHMYTYDETAKFTENLANIIVNAAPNLCTTERLKKKRHGKLYIDYVQHGKKKTIIAPYSPRKTTEATIATPLDWSEVNEDLSPDMFTMDTVQGRLRKRGCPWYFEYEKTRGQSFKKAAPLFLE